MELDNRIRSALVKILFSDGIEPRRTESAAAGAWVCPGDGEAAGNMLDEMVEAVKGAMSPG